MGIQSLALKWCNYEFATYTGYKYARVKSHFVLTDSANYTIALVQSDDETIGIIIAIPSITYNFPL